MDNIKKFLFKESSTRIVPVESSQEVPEIIKMLNSESENRVKKIKSAKRKQASIEKEAMARGRGDKDLRYSTANLEWTWPELTQRMQEIKSEIEQQYAPYMYSVIAKKKADIPPNLLPDPDGQELQISNDTSQFNGEPQASLVMRFQYRRRILPQQGQDPEAYQRATNSVESLDRTLPGFKGFLEAIEKNDLSLSPYFQTSAKNIPWPVLSKFIKEQNRQNPQYFQDHVAKMNDEGGSFYSAIQLSHDRIYPNSDIDHLTHPSYVLRALQDKVRQGYILDGNVLKRALEQKKQKTLDLLKLDPSNLTDTQRNWMASLDQHYNRLGRNIVRNFRQGCMWKEGEPPKGSYPWGERTIKDKKEYRPGIAEKAKGNRLTTLAPHDEVSSIEEVAANRHRACVGLSLEEAKLALQSCTMFIGQGTPEIGPDEFFISRFKTSYYPNGLDTNPKRDGGRMLTIPPLLRAPTVYELVNGQRIELSPEEQSETGERWKVSRYGDVIYDQDNCNLGREHCVKNFYHSSGGLKGILQQFGQQAAQWMQLLSRPETIQTLSPQAQHAWAAAIGGANTRYKPKRTGAETILDLLRKYNNYETFNANVLSSSYEAVMNAYRRAGTTPGDPLSELRKRYDAGQITWAQFTQESVRNGFVRLNVQSEEETKMRPEDFNLYKQYAYPVAKMMDFAHALMTACCHERKENRLQGDRSKRNLRVEHLYGQNYSSSSGVGAGGQIMFGVKYAYPAPEITEDPNLLALVKKERHNRTSTLRPQQETWRRTQHPETLKGPNVPALVPPGMAGDDADQERERFEVENGVVLTVTESLNYFIGQAGSTKTGAMIRTKVEGPDWYTLLDRLVSDYPDLQQQLGVLISPINANLSAIANSQKKAIDTVRSKIETLFQENGKNIPLEVLYRAANGQVELLTGAGLQVSEAIANTDKSQASADLNNQSGQTMPASQPESVKTTETTEATPDVQTEEAPAIAPDVSEISSKTPPTQTEAVPVGAGNNEPTEPETSPMAMPGSSQGQFISKERRRNLLRADVIHRLRKVADELDERGLSKLADRFDVLLEKLS